MVLAGEPALNLGPRFETTDFGGAVDLAFAYVERPWHSPYRDAAPGQRRPAITKNLRAETIVA